MPQSVVKSGSAKIISCKGKNFPIIFIHNPAFTDGYNIIKAPPLMHSESQWSVLIFISKGKLHLVAIGELSGTSLDPLKAPLLLLPCKCMAKKRMHLCFLDPKLFIIGQRKIGTASAIPEMGAGTAYLK